MQYVIAPDTTQQLDLQQLLGTHLAFANDTSPPDDVHALDIEALGHTSVRLLSARSGDKLLGIGALRILDDHHGELKSMHTAASARGQGVGRALACELLSLARGLGLSRVSLETGTMDAFSSARRLYEALGFEVCEPFGGYTSSPNSVCMTTLLNSEITP